ncbi:MAG TPA: PrsW family glutamic-type intramembrane protease [Dongiaceae bacterium]|nr:PrsW family glutamic-type intramembrane protease [Dongiaceae bacterium]
MTLNDLAVLAIGLFCAGLFILLFQYLFPRRAPWRLVASALVAGLVVTYLLTLILRHSLEPTMAALQELSSLADAVRLATLRAALPEEAVKAAATLLALLPFWRRATPAAAFQAALVAAIGFALVENRGYAAAFENYGVLIAFGRGFMATFIHATVAMTFGAFLMRFVAGGWTGWHWILLGYLAASLCHALHDAGLLLPTAEYLRTGTVAPMTVLSAAPIVIFGFGVLLVSGLWSLRHATRRAALGDPITEEPRHQRSVRRWRFTGNLFLGLGALGLIGAVVWIVLAESQPGEPDKAMLYGMFGAGAIIGALFLFLIGWVLRQKR